MKFPHNLPTHPTAELQQLLPLVLNCLSAIIKRHPCTGSKLEMREYASRNLSQLLSPRRREDRANDWNSPAPDLWHTLNVIQENVIKGGLHAVQHGVDERGRRTRRNITTRQVNGIDQDVKLNRAMWMLAERMAELKGTVAA